MKFTWPKFDEAPVVQNLDVSAVQRHMQSAKPIVSTAASTIDTVWPVLENGYHAVEDVYVKLQPYKPELLAPVILGLFLVFFGGSYMGVIAACEAFRVTGGFETLQKCYQMLHTNYAAAREATEADSKVDANKDGIPDVLQITDQQRLTRRLLVVVKAVDPMQLQDALGDMGLQLMAVVATLRMRFAEAVTLGTSIGLMMEKGVTPYASPALKKLMPDEYHKWTPFIIATCTKMVGVSIAWTVFRVISSLYTAVRGAYLVSLGSLHYAKSMGWLRQDFEIHAVSPAFNASVLLWTVVGVYYQLSRHFAVPFPFNVILMPLTTTEWFIQAFMSA